MALRQQVWVDRSVQGVLVGRVILYWLCALLYVGIGSACFQYNQNPEWTLTKHFQVLFGQIWPWLPTAFILLPLAIYDVVRMSNLFAGPIYRLRQHFGALREDIACAPLVFREEDYWRDLAAPINDMQAEILRLRTGIIELQKAASKSASESTVNSYRNSSNQADSENPGDATHNSHSHSEKSIQSIAEPNFNAEPASTEKIASDVAGSESVAGAPVISEIASKVAIGDTVGNEVVASETATSEKEIANPASTETAVIEPVASAPSADMAAVAIAPLPTSAIDAPMEPSATPAS